MTLLWLRWIFPRQRRHAQPWPALVILAWLKGSAFAAATAGFTLTMDCPFCGPGQPLPHDCPRARGSAATRALAEAFPRLADAALQESRRLRAISGLNLPELGEARTLAELDAGLTRFIAAVENEIARCERERADFGRHDTIANTENADISRVSDQLAGEIAQARGAVAPAEIEVAAEMRAAAAARDEVIALQKSLNEIRAEIRNVRNRLFPHLHQAAHHGWITPPSSYRPLPVPMPPRTQRDSQSAPDLRPDLSAMFQLRGGSEVSPTPRPTPAVPELGADEDVAAKVGSLAGLGDRARAAVARRDDALRLLQNRGGEADPESARLSTLQVERNAAMGELEAAKRRLGLARQAHADHAARLSHARATAVHAWVEWGIFQLLEKKAATLFTEAVGRSGDSAYLKAWGELAAAAVQLGSDPLGMIAQWPRTLAERGESLDELRQDLARVREQFGLQFAGTGADVPAAALPYVMKTP